MKKYSLSRRTQIAAALISVIVFSLLLSACAGISDTPSGDTITLTDSAGRTVSVPRDPEIICTLSAFAGPLACLFGYSEQMMATSNNVLRSNFLKEMCPAVRNAVNVKNSGTMNAESILAIEAEIIFVDLTMYSDSDERAKLETMGIPYVVVDFTDTRSQTEAAMIVGKALGCEEEAARYVEYYREAMESVSAVIADSVTDKFRVYHSVNEITRTDSANSLGAEWTATAGAINVSVDSELTSDGDKTMANVEQILLWDPEVIICNEAGIDDLILSDPRFQGVNAVLNGRVYQIPVGVTRYGHPNGIETPLAIYWLAKTLYPDLFDYTIEEKIKEFYLEFFDYEVSDETVAAILKADDIRSPK